MVVYFSCAFIRMAGIVQWVGGACINTHSLVVAAQTQSTSSLLLDRKWIEIRGTLPCVFSSLPTTTVPYSSLQNVLLLKATKAHEKYSLSCIHLTKKKKNNFSLSFFVVFCFFLFIIAALFLECRKMIFFCLHAVLLETELD